jgi:hypothetical protein
MFLALIALLLVLSHGLGLSKGLVANIALASTSAALSAGYDLSWWTVDGGGHTLSISGDYILGSTVGQPDAGVLSGGDYTLGGGFWGGGAAAVEHEIYLPLVLR